MAKNGTKVAEETATETVEKVKRPRFNPELPNADELKALVEAGTLKVNRVPARGEVGGKKYTPEHDEFVIGNRAAALTAFKNNEKNVWAALSLAFNLLLKRAGSADPEAAEKRELRSYRKALVNKLDKFTNGSKAWKLAKKEVDAFDAEYPDLVPKETETAA